MTMYCYHCGEVDPDPDELCPVKGGKRHSPRAQLAVSTELGSAPRAVAPGRKKAKGFTPASDEQKAKRKQLEPFCIHCGDPATDSMHVIPRGMTSVGQEDERATVSGCRDCHVGYDTGRISLLEDLEMHAKDVLAFAVERVGLITALQRITNRRWVPRESAGERAA